MRKTFKKFLGFTLSEAMIVLVIFGVIGMIVIPQLKTENASKRGWTTLSVKMGERLQQATTEMLALNASLDDLTVLKSGDSVFSIADPDVTPKMVDLFTQYFSDVDYKVDTTKPYFTQSLLDFKRNPVGGTVGSLYSNFHFATDGILVGYRFYGTCNATELNANPPKNEEKYIVTNICGSVFYDVNAYKKPNKLGSDQYIIPIGIRGMQYDNSGM